MPKCVKGPLGNINCDGKFISPANIVSNEDNEFWEYIEEGVKPLVSAFLSNGFKTYGCCEGHFDGEVILYPHIRFYSSRELDYIMNTFCENYNKKHLCKLIFEMSTLYVEQPYKGNTSKISLLINGISGGSLNREFINEQLLNLSNEFNMFNIEKKERIGRCLKLCFS